MKKINTLHFVSFLFSFLLLANAFVIVGAKGTAKAQSTIPNINQRVLNGLFSPTASERFLEEGNRNIEREIQILRNPKLYKREDILQIHKTDSEIIKETETKKSIPNSVEDILQQKLD